MVQGETATKHNINLSEACKVAKKNSLVFSPGKCSIKAQQIVYFGYLLGRDGIQADPRKTKTITDLAYPMTIQELQSFLGMVNFLMLFLHHLADKTAPLNELLKKEAVFYFDENCKHCFDNVKDAVKDSWKQGLYDPEEDLVLEVDASTKGLGVCLM